MENSSQEPWSISPNAPQIPYQLYFAEKANTAGVLIGAVFYGIVTVLFFKCMGALLDPLNHTRKRVKWGLMVHATTMFSLATIYIATGFEIHSTAYIDNREFTGVDGSFLPGPIGYKSFVYSKAISIVPNAAFLLNDWLADSLLLYRCFILYSRSYWVVTFPCLMFLASFSTGIMLIYQTSQPGATLGGHLAEVYGFTYFSISLSLTVLVTLMIAVRLTLHSRNVVSAIGAPAGMGGLYKAVMTMLVESYALYAASSILVIGTWFAQSPITDAFLPLLAQTRVIAPLLITLRVANQSALTSNGVASGDPGFMRFRSRGGSMNSSGTYPGSDPKDSMSCGETSIELDIVDRTMVDSHPDTPLNVEH